MYLNCLKVFSLGKRDDDFIFGIEGYSQSHLVVCRSALFSLGSLSSKGERELLQTLPVFWIHSSPQSWPVPKDLNFSEQEVPKFYSGTFQK